MSVDYSVNRVIRSSSDLRERLIECAATMVEAGDAEISLRGVARAAGVSAMAPYRHFPDKAALIGAVASSGFDVLRQELEAADRSNDDKRRALIAQGVAYVTFARDHPALFRMMFADPSTTTLAPNCDTDAYSVLANRVASLTVDDGETAALACWSIVHGLAMLMLDARIPDGSERAETVLTLFVRGLTSTLNRHLPRCDMR
ncbi:TetR/AcrR family transcriptional regulator [Sphingomonas mollis]|uniref:TetR/AcrR family transcriptional regulator n=1 Tax=Sphingomonas mollis TaxID=2795726 RepID=A0ABS0XRT3_9SPHN|nr:TetR/AcrR family transcriptional regulator [Sphingomonas sp. BT553]MBJ6122732.1 TetR/AcrR family transcriptional regulator [Sphingomonas sp. BT553]